jgi:translation initiation factor 2-alpha kinase 4
MGQMEMSTEDVDRTSNIGTSSYIAPEVLVSKSYNEKADMYSLGVIFFEMCYAFKTGMERNQVLGALRTPKVVFPDEWPPSRMPKQREIISLLMNHDPSMRPQATQLLSGPLVPTINMGEQFYDSVIAEITNPRSEKYPALIDALFETDAKSKFHMDNRTEDYTYDNEHDDTLFSWQTVVNGRIKKLFRRHGAMEVYLPLLLPETTLLNPYPEKSPVRLLDVGGRFVRLPSSNLVGMARSTSRQRIERIKRYVAAQRYSELAAGGQPGTHMELCFEIISPVRSLAAEGELLELMDRVVLECLGPKQSAVVDYEFHISHESILASLLSTCPSQLRSKVLKAFKGPATGVSFGHSRPSLATISGLPPNCIHDIEKVSPVDEFDAVKKVLEETYPQFKRKFAFAFEEIQTAIRLARSSGVKRKILLRPTLSKHSEYYRGGIMFECVRKTKHSEVLGYGGRHDSLLDHFKDPQIHTRPVHGVNLSIASDMLTRIVRKQELANAKDLMSKRKSPEERSFGVWAPNRCDVYVSSTSAVSIGDRLAMCGQLWRAGIRADLQYDDGRTLQQVIEECNDQSILYVVIIRGHKDEAKVIRVLTGKNSEESVPEDKLIGWLKTGIEAQRRTDRAYADGTTPIVRNQAKEAQEQQQTTRLTNVDIHLVLPPEPLTTRGVKNKATRKYRHGTKAVYYEKADEFAANVQSALPIIAVDLAPDLLSSMTLETNWITDDEAWRTLTHSVLPNSERNYGAEVRRAVAEHAKSPGGCVWLFSVREARGFLLQLPAAPNHR